MRTLEVLVLIALAPLIVAILFPVRRVSWLRILAWTALALALLQIIIEGYRWQMIPAYLLVIAACLRAQRPRGTEARDSLWRRAVRLAFGVVGIVAWTAVLLLGSGMPVFRAPTPAGPYSVGTAQLYFSDASRQDPFAPNPRAPRELLVVAWYPAERAPGIQPEPFWPDAPVTGPVLARLLHLPGFGLLGHLRLVRSHSYPRTEITQTQPRFPVLIFSHGYGGTPWQNTLQMEELASHGFIIFSIGHTYESAAITFPDGRVAVMNGAEMRRAMNDRSNGDLVKQRLDTWVADTRYVIDQLTAINAGVTAGPESGKRFTGRLDLTRLGVFGMSFGGATAGEFCVQDARCKAGLNIDGKQSGTVAEHPLSVPFLYFAHEANNDNDLVYARSRGDLYGIQVRHSEHGNFLDANLVAPISKHIGLLGSVDRLQMERILNAYTLGFFQKYLEGKPSVLLDGPAHATSYPEVVFRTRKVLATQ